MSIGNNAVQSVENCPIFLVTSCKITPFSRLCKNNNGVRNSFHTFSVTRIITVERTGFNNGSTIVKNLLNTDHPSTIAASSSSIGTLDSINSLIRNTACGILIATSTRITAHAVFISPRLFTILYKLIIFI